MFRVSQEIEFCYGHRLLNYDGKCRFLHGHNGKAVIVLEAAALDDCGILVDFSEIRKQMASWIEGNLDHRMILNEADPVVQYLKEQAEPLFLMATNPTAENIARVIYEFAKSQRLPVREVSLWESYRSCATYSEVW